MSNVADGIKALRDALAIINEHGKNSSHLARIIVNNEAEIIAAVDLLENFWGSCIRKLTEDQVRKILVDDRQFKTIAAAYEVSAMTISNIKNRRSWKHITGGQNAK